MIRYPQDMVEIRNLVRRKPGTMGERVEVSTLQYRVKNISVVDYTETWTPWTDVPTEYIDE